MIQAALHCGVLKVLFTSTDKAIGPTNTYGATKLTAERLISSAEYHKGNKPTDFFSVRFGNVMGSRGSVIPLFKQQILEKGHITLTDPEMVRYMMTPSQAITLMLKAMSIAKGGEVFVLKMPVIKLSDLADILIDEVSEKYGIQSPLHIDIVGLRPGEKMYEELMTSDEARSALEIDDMYIIPSLYSDKKYTYDNAMYASETAGDVRSERAISKEKLRDWIISEQLI
ncbi:UDP-N-acetylglucosamine 4,6-dehydratase [compost metagenome]